ncbi:MAG: molybdopterin synthase sulfur carrier subunit [Promethearchaeota archaeon]|nr:MAG: molybdopterin synthase sulfur carrier subunit [Candidatus Lokiarchaeota archaeon]
MPKVKLNLLNIFALKLKKNMVEYEGETVGDVIRQFVKEHKDQLDNNLLNKKKTKLNKQILILVNGRNIEHLNNYKTPLKEGDSVYLSIPLSGG